MSFDARHPEAAMRARADTSPFPAALSPIKISPDVMAKIGETFAAELSSVQATLSSLEHLSAIDRSSVDAVLAAVQRLERFGLQLQTTARVLAGTAPLPREHLDLARAAREAIAQWSEEACRLGASLGAPSRSLEIDANAASIAQLLDLGIEYALHVGHCVDISVGAEGISIHPVLTIRARASGLRNEAADAGLVELLWLLFDDLARALGLVPRRAIDGLTTMLTLAFPGPEGDGALDSMASAALPRTAPADGRRVLVIEPQELARVLTSRLLGAVGMRVTAATHVEQAREWLGSEAGTPDIVVTGIATDETSFHALLDDLRAAQPRLRVVELVDDASAFDFSVPGSDAPARVSRQDLSRTLVRAVSQELDAAWNVAARA